MKKRLIIGLATALLIVVAVSAVQGRTDDEQDQILTEVTGALDRMPQVFINMPKNDPSGPRVLWADWATKKILTQAGEIADLQETVKRLVEGRIGGTSTAAAPIAAQPVVQDIVSQPAVDYASSLAKYTRAVDEQVIKNDQLIKEMSTGSVSATSTDPTVLNRLSEVEKIAKSADSKADEALAKSTGTQAQMDLFKKSWGEFLDGQERALQEFRAKLGAPPPPPPPRTTPCK